VVLATQCADQAALLAVMVEAYTALEKIVTHDRDSLERAATRDALGSLMRALNGEMERQVDAMVRDSAELSAIAGGELGLAARETYGKEHRIFGQN
jgi:hypothetical protein